MKRLTNTRLSFLIALAYVVAGTVYGYRYWVALDDSGPLTDALLYSFYPAAMPVGLFLWSERNPLPYTLLTEAVVLLLLWGLLRLLLGWLRP
ncbi:hypothetical protein [Flaviaesturariibacter amylovorans]|uniref:Uncharacterized protein n=1 Tax=Flaviaesturariibacter amylovorans TaxID=1084520 RepID=A0ABP8HU37_9BACT